MGVVGGVGRGGDAGDDRGDVGLERLAAQLLASCVRRGLTVATAESCTGGLVAATITAVAGASAIFRGSIVSYADDAKVALLRVDQAVIAAHGAVSAQVAVAMAAAARERFGSSAAVSVTGVAGPGGGTADKPVGLTYLGLATSTGTDVRRFHWTGDRTENREASVRAALEWLIGWAEAAAT